MSISPAVSSPVPISSECFRDQTLFVTGCSGFLGKVVLEKLMRSFECKRIYVLLRTKKNKDTRLRFRSDILGSEIFHTLRKEKGEGFDRWANSLVVPIAGDLLVSRIGISDPDRARLCSEVNVIIHSAASVDFDLPLEEATAINVDGSLAMLELAQECTQLRSHVHVSTCYVNAHLNGIVKETVYPSPFDIHEMYARIKRSSSDQLARDRQSILGEWPNTYTFTKFLTEHLLLAKRGSVPLVVCRPSIISAALQEPVPGWTDCISAASAVFLAIGMGIIPVMPGSLWNVADVIPVDVCAHMIIAATQLTTAANAPPFSITHCGTSSFEEPMAWFSAVDAVCEYFTTHRLANRIRSASVKLVPNEVSFDIQRYLSTHLPQRLVQFMEAVSGSPTLTQLAKAIRGGDRVVSAFSHFTINEWIFESALLTNSVFADPPTLLLLSVRQIDWMQYIHVVCYGMRKFCLGEAHAEVPLNMSIVGDVLSRTKVAMAEAQHPNPFTAWFADILWAKGGAQMNYAVATHASVERGVLRNPQVVAVMEKLVRGKKTPELVRADAIRVLHSIGTKFDYSNTRFFGWTLQKVFSTLYERVSVNEDVLGKIADLERNWKSTSNGPPSPILLIPTHRSYMDFLILSFILFAYHVKMPFIAAGEDFQKIPGINSFLRKSGAFFMKRKLDPKTDPLYVALFKGYFQQIILEHGLVEFFIEGGRSRTGQMLHPKFGLLSFAMELLFDKQLADLHIVPVSMSYERVLEAESFPRELLGESKAKESLARMVKAVSVLKTKYGRAHVVLGEPISVKEWIASEVSSRPVCELTTDQRFDVVKRLGGHVTRCLSHGMVYMSTHLVAAVMLAGTRRGVRQVELISRVEWLRNEIRDRGQILEVPPTGTCSGTVETCLNFYLHSAINKVGEVVEIRSANLAETRHSTLTLAYYRNQLLSVFSGEAVVVVALLASQPGLVGKTQLLKDALFVATLCGLEELSSEVLQNTIDKRLVEMGTLIEESVGGVISYRLNDQFVDRISFIAGLLHPQVDVAWVSAMALGWNSNKAPHTVAGLAADVQVLAKSLIDERIVRYHEACSLEGIKLALHAFVKSSIIDKNCAVKVADLDSLVARIAKFRRRSAGANEANENDSKLSSSRFDSFHPLEFAKSLAARL